MATMNPMSTAGGSMDPSTDQDGPDAEGGYIIMVHVQGDGKISVGVETEAEEDQEGQSEAGESGEDEDMQEVPSIREACKLVMQIFQSQGRAPDTAQDQADMSAGYGK